MGCKVRGSLSFASWAVVLWESCGDKVVWRCVERLRSHECAVGGVGVSGVRARVCKVGELR